MKIYTLRTEARPRLMAKCVRDVALRYRLRDVDGDAT